MICATGRRSGFSENRGTNEDTRVLHELRVHKVELEMQNARNSSKPGISWRGMVEKYSDLFDFAPVGYVTLDHDGTNPEP